MATEKLNSLDEFKEKESIPIVEQVITEEETP